MKKWPNELSEQCNYVKEHEPELEPRTITVELRKEDNFLSTASRPGTGIKWYADESKERGGSSKGLAHSPTSSQAWVSASSSTTPNTPWSMGSSLNR
jgi:hypothetical protein